MRKENQSQGAPHQGPSETGRFTRAFALAGTMVLLALLVVAYVPGTGTSAALHGMNRAMTRTVATAAPAVIGFHGAPFLHHVGEPRHDLCLSGDEPAPPGVGLSRVTLSANAGGAGYLAWPRSRSFVIETTDYDASTTRAPATRTDPCASTTGTVCEESNGVPFFVAHAQDIANAISAANPHSQVSFALVDYFATLDYPFDDGDGSEYHVDIQQFLLSFFRNFFDRRS